ncbi:MAG: multidrug effflux MFS transporter [Azospirillaceae bacterium]
MTVSDSSSTADSGESPSGGSADPATRAAEAAGRFGDLRVTAMAAMFVALGPLTMSMYAPAMPALARSLDTTPGLVQLTLTVYLAAFAIAQLVYGPLSDRFGRRPVLIAGMVIFVAGSALAASARSIELLLAARLVQAVGACAGPAIARALVRDLYAGPKAAKVMALIGMALTLAPAVGPVLGGHLQGWFGWRSIFVVLGAFGLAVMAVALFALTETNRHKDPEALDPRRMARNYATLATTGLYMGYVAIVACTLGGLLSYVAGSPFVMIDILGLSPEVYGWLTLFTTSAYFVGATTANRLVARLGIERMALIGASCVLAGGLILLAFAAAGVVAVITLTGPMMIWTAGMGIVFPTAMAGALGPFPRMAGAASALMGFFQMGAGAAGSIGVAVLEEGPWGGTALPVALMPAILGLVGFTTFLALVWRRRGAG